MSYEVHPEGEDVPAGVILQWPDKEVVKVNLKSVTKISYNLCDVGALNLWEVCYNVMSGFSPATVGSY